MHRLCGIETEYGIAVEGKDASDLHTEVGALLAACPLPAVDAWDYAAEDPRRDQRGFRVANLATDPEDAKLERPAPPTVGWRDLRADHVLTNGARLYNDHAHPEYSTPECLSLADLVAHDRAGERIVLTCARAYEARTGATVRLFKNNTDYHGFSYGCHENYLISRAVAFEAIIQGLLPFLVTRQIFAGAGKVGLEREASREPLYQLSQRADYFTEVVGVDTQHRRPLINTRDEPHADARRYRRLHCILGDANMSEYATALKVGTTSLVLSLIERGFAPPWQLLDPLGAARHISRDPTWRWEVALTDGHTLPAPELQRLYLKAAREAFTGEDGETDRVLDEWAEVLDTLQDDPMKLDDRLDWVIKRRVLDEADMGEGEKADLDLLQSLDLQYHDIDLEAGLYLALEQAGAVQRVVDEEAVRRAMSTPPPDTRAAIRGMCVSRFAEAVRGLSWAYVDLMEDGRPVRIDMANLVDGRLETAALERASTPRELAEIIGGWSHDE